MGITYAVVFILMHSVYFEKVSKAENYLCRSNADCSSNKQVSTERCSLCADTNSGKSECVFPFPYMFKTGDLKCDKVDPCPINCPSVGANCVQSKKYPVKYTPSCECLHRFYGTECQYKATRTQRPITYVTWVFKGFIPVYHTTELKFKFYSPYGSDFRSTRLLLITKDGYFYRRLRWNKVRGECYFGPQRCASLSMNVKFPYKMYSRTATTQFITLKNRVQGYYANFSIYVKDLGKFIYIRQFQIVVSYEKKILKCVASIKLRNCSPSAEAPTIFTRLSGIDFIGELLYVTDGGYVSTSVANEKCSKGNIFTWKLWYFTVLEVPPLFQNFTTQAWHFNPYTLHPGKYEVLFHVRHVNGQASNFAYCYIEVKSLPLIIRVDGGSERTVNKNDGVTLSAVRSKDPNMPASKQGDLRVEWSCKRIKPPIDNDPICKPITMNVHRSYFIPPEKLMYSAEYNFSAKLYSKCTHCDVEPEYASILIRVGSETANKSMSIQCVENCKDKVIPNKQFFLEVISKNININFSWTYSIGSGEETPLDSIKIGGIPPFMMLIKENSFVHGTEYTITVRHMSEGIYAKYRFITDNLSYDGVCKVEPLNGTRGLTKFDITCPWQSEVALIFEFYDKNEEDRAKNQSFNGRMLGTTSTGQLRNVMLSRGYVTVYIINAQGLSLKQEIFVELSDGKNIDDILTSLKANLSHSVNHFRNEQHALRLTSLITDILPIGSNKENESNLLLVSLSKVTFNSFDDIKMVSLTLSSVLRFLNQPVQLTLQTKLFFKTLEFINRLLNYFRRSVLNRETSQYVHPKVIEDMSETLLVSVMTLLQCKTNKTVDPEHDAKDIEYIAKLIHGAHLTNLLIGNLMDILSFVQYPGKPPIRISTMNDKVIFWSLKNNAIYPITHFLGNNSGIPVGITAELMHSLTGSSYQPMDLALQIGYMNDSSLKWYKSDIKSDMVSVSLALQEGERDPTYIRTLRHPITIHMTMDDNLVNMKLEGSVIQADPSLDQDYLDMQVKIHRLDIEPRSRLTIVFLYPPTNGSLRVSVMEEYRPDFNYMIEHSIIISKFSVEYPVKYHDYDEPKFVYMGIIPGNDVSINESVSYAFEVNTTLCQSWSRGFWKSDGCLVSRHTQGKKIICLCTHLSTFGTAFLVPPQQVDPFEDAKLFVTVLDNPHVVAFIITFLLFYIVLSFYLWHLDYRDQKRKNVIVLEDNFPFDKYPYLLAVFTSSRLNAGTTAHVGVKVVGSEAESRPHILTSRRRKVLKTGYDDWFLIYSPKYLGDIEHLHLWHDNAGWNPSWFCENVFVYDLTKNTETKFVVKEWLAVDFVREETAFCYPETKVLPYEDEDISSVKTRFFDNVVLGIFNGLRVMRVFSRHPRRRETRVQSLSTIMVFVMATMLNSIMYYKPADETKIGIDYFSYSFRLKEFMISVQSVILSTVLTYILIFTFQHSYKMKPYDNDRRSILSNLHKKNKGKTHKNFISNILSFINIYPPLDPVQLPKSPQVIEKRWMWYIFAWISCITIISTTSYLIMLYGLKLGPVKSQMWWTSVLFSMGEDAFIAGPAKIILLSFVFSLAFQLMIDVNTYQIRVDDLDQEHLFDENDIEKIFNNRKHEMYSPMSLQLRNKIVEEKRLLSNWLTVLDFVVATAFLITTCNIIFRIWSSNYYINSHIHDMVSNKKYPLLRSISFNEVTNITQLEQYLSNTFINIVYNKRRNVNQRPYQGSSGHYEYLTSDLTNVLVGLPRIRQLRIEPIPCNNIVMPNGLCIPEWKESYEDINTFTKGWNPGTYTDTQKNDSYWVYKDESSSFSTAILRLYGRSGRLFHDGGYTVTLGPTRLEAEQTLDELQEYRWQDEKTRVVFVEFTTFNGNKIFFSQVTLLVEYLVTGAVLLKAQVISTRSAYYFYLSNCLFVVFILLFIIKSVYMINYFGLLEYLSSGIDSIFHVLSIVIGILSIVLFCAHFYTVTKYTDQFKKSGNEGYFNFDSLVQFMVLLRLSLLILQCLTTFLFIRSIRGGTSVMAINYTFKSSLRYIFCLSFLFLLAFYVIRLWSLLLDIASSCPKELLLNSKSLKFVRVHVIQYTYVKLLIISKRLLIFVVNAFFLLVLINSTRLSKAHEFSPSQRFNSLTFVVSKINVRWKKIMSRYR